MKKQKLHKEVGISMSMSEWIFICNPSYYDVVGAFNKNKKINWKQNNNSNVEVGDIVYIYVGKPYQEIKYETIATKVEIPELAIDDSEFFLDGKNYADFDKYMELELVRTFDTGLLPYKELKQNGLKIVQWPTKASEGLSKYIAAKKESILFRERQYFFVFQNKSYKEERQGEYLWAPQKNSIGNKVDHWERMAGVKKGDFIIHSVGRKLCAISIAQEDSKTEIRPEELSSVWADIGWKVNTKYYDIEVPIEISNHVEQFLTLQPKKHGPLNIKGGGKQGYLFCANKAMVEYIIEESTKKQNSNRTKKNLNVLQDSITDLENQLDQDLVDGVDDLLSAYLETEMADEVGPKEKPEIKTTEKGQTYARDKKTSIKALTKAKFKCELDNQHPSFIRRKGNVAYTEPHHLIPMAQQSKFDYSLDVMANIVSLCSNCHNQIHYGMDYELMIDKFYSQRKDELTKAGISVDLETLKSFY